MRSRVLFRAPSGVLGLFFLWASATATVAASSPDLVLVALPTACDCLETAAPDEPITLAYRVVEVLAGEPGGASLVVRHDRLAADDRDRLRAGERVILIASHDPANPGRYTASAPLRATPSAVAAFRKWSAPEDVRAPRPLSEVVAEVQRLPASDAAAGTPAVQPPRAPAAASPATIGRSAASPPPKPAKVVASAGSTARPAATAPRPAVAARTTVTQAASPTGVAREPGPAPTTPAATRSIAAPRREPSAASLAAGESEEAVAARVEVPARPSPADREPEPVLSTAAVAATPAFADPRPGLPATNPAILPPAGPGLPPEPSAAVLGPALQERKDLTFIGFGRQRSPFPVH